MNNYSENDFGDTHSLVLLVDSLNVQNVLQRLAPAVELNVLNDIFKAASSWNSQFTFGTQGKAEGNVLENVVNSLADLLLGPAYTPQLEGSPNGNTWFSVEDIAGYTGRDKFYQVLTDILDPTKSGFETLAGQLTLSPKVGNLRDSARTDFGAFAALYSLSPFRGV